MAGLNITPKAQILVIVSLTLSACLGKPVAQDDSGTETDSSAVVSGNTASPFDVVSANTPPDTMISISTSEYIHNDEHEHLTETGTIREYSSPSRFRIGYRWIDASSTSRFDNGYASALANGKCIEARGHLHYVSSDLVLLADRVKFLDSYYCG